jgi:hypothetical protein
MMIYKAPSMTDEQAEQFFKYALSKNRVEENYFSFFFHREVWKANRMLLIRAFLHFSALDMVESFGGHCKSCNTFNSDLQTENTCWKCGEIVYENWEDDRRKVEEITQYMKKNPCECDNKEDCSECAQFAIQKIAYRKAPDISTQVEKMSETWRSSDH